MMTQIYPAKRGITLLETVIYVALLTVILTGMLVSIYPLFTGADHITQKVTAEGEAAFILRKINWALSNPDPFNPITLPVSGTGNILNLTTVDGDTITIALINNAITFNGEKISNSRVPVTTFDVTRSTVSGLTLVEVEFDINGKHVGPWQKYLPF